MASASDKTSQPGHWAILEGVVGNVLAVLNVCQLLQEPVGARIRPMGVAYAAFWVSLVTACFTVPLAVSAISTKRQRLVGLIGITLALTPVVVSVVLSEYFVASRQLFLLP